MSATADELRESEFYRKKLHRATAMRDVDHDGTLSRHDFELIVQRYRDLIGVPEEQLKENNHSNRCAGAILNVKYGQINCVQ